MGISRQPSPIQTTIDQQQPKNEERSNYLGSIATNGAWGTCEMKSRTVTSHTALNKKKNFFRQQIGFKLKEETGKVLHLEHNFVWCWNLDTSVSRSGIPGKFWDVVLQKDGEDKLDRSCEKWRSITKVKKEMNVLHTIRRNANWCVHTYCRNCILKQVIEGKAEGRIQVTGRRGRRRKQQLYGLKEKRGH
jgi:hypothetical protein